MSLVLRSEAEARYPYNAVGGYDHLSWAKRIVYRDDRGDKDLLPIQVAFARQALALPTKLQGE